MSAPSKQIFSVGMNGSRYFALTAAGYPAATNITNYSGVAFGAPIALALKMSAPEIVRHPGNNMTQQYDVLPGDGVSEGSLTVSREDADAIAAFSNTNVHVIAAAFNAIGWGTSQQGNEPIFGIMAYDQAKDKNGLRVWRTHMIPKAIITPAIKGMERARGDIVYSLQPLVCAAYLTGLAFTAINNGFLTAQVLTLTSSHRLALGTWVTTATETAYPFDADLPKYVTGDAGQAVYKNGVLMTYGAGADATHYQATTTGLTFGAALTNGDVVTCLYEIADTAIDIDT